MKTACWDAEIVVVARWHEVGGPIMHQHCHSRPAAGVHERHADHGMINNARHPLVETGLPYPVFPLLVAGDPHNPVVTGGDHLEEDTGVRQ
jgi:hypothetical protein